MKPIMNLPTRNGCATVPFKQESTRENSEAFADLYVKYSRRLYRTIFAITRNHEDAEDVLHETFLQASMSIHAFEGRSTIYTWMTRIAINSALLTLRKRRIRAEVLLNLHPDKDGKKTPFEFTDPAPNPEQVCEQRQRRMRLRRAIGRLSANLREPLRMQALGECSLEEISLTLDISIGAVKSRLHRARERILAGGVRR